MLGFLGDIHGDSAKLKRMAIECANQELVALIQVGDLGWYNKTIDDFTNFKYPLPVYWIDGNHEQFPLLRSMTGDMKQVTELAPNFFYVPRGTTLEIDGRKILFFGGAGSVDKQIRLRLGWHWYDDENIRDWQIELVNVSQPVDLMVTHVPPQEIIERNFDPNMLLMFDLPPTWVDDNAVKIGKLWNDLQRPPLYAGHMHRSVVDGNVRILNIDEFCVVK